MLTSAAQIFVRLPGRRRLCVPAGFTSDDAKFMALAISQAAASAPEVPVGAVIVKDGAVLATARQLPGTLDHAEILAMKAACETAGVTRLDGAVLYCTLEPCVMCMGACILHKIQRVVYGASSPKFGSCGGVVDLTTLGPKLRVPSASQRAPTLSSSDTCKLFNHMPIVQGGLLAEESVQLLQECFASKRRDGEGSALQAQDLI